jgi:prolyl oligopeptidase
LLRCASALLILASVAFPADGPPPTKAIPVTETLHGVSITDPYRWLEDQNSPETRAWLGAQNAYTRAYLDKIPGRDKLKQRLAELSRVDAVGLPVVRNGRYFFSRRGANENQASICMRSGFDGKDEVLVDPKTFGDESYSVALADVADDGSLMAYAVRHGGEDEVEIRFLDVNKREPLPFQMAKARNMGLAITHDRRGIFYSQYVNGKGSRVYYHTAGSANDREIFGSQYGPEALIEARLTDDGRYLLIDVVFGVPARRTEVFIKDVARDGPIQPVVKLDAEIRPFLEAGGKLYVSTNWKAPNWRVAAIDLANPAPEKWADVVPEAQ